MILQVVSRASTTFTGNDFTYNAFAIKETFAKKCFYLTRYLQCLSICGSYSFSI